MSSKKWERVDDNGREWKRMEENEGEWRKVDERLYMSGREIGHLWKRDN